MATSTIMGRGIFALGAVLTSSIFYSGPTTVNEAVTAAPREARTAAAISDLVVDLPGLQNIPEFDQFAGYFDVEATKHVFYWYVESQSNPATDPVIFWTNGGPSCSGLLGLGTEHGPFFITESGKLHENPYSWNKVANVLYVEQPAGVGFSFTDREEDLHTGDAVSSANNYELIRQFIQRFPERQSNPFYIASESYGGHYIPQLGLEILKQNTDNLINFQGLFVGNPWVDPFSNTISEFSAYYHHGLLAKPLYDNFMVLCNDPSTLFTDQCDDIMGEMWASFGDGTKGGINPYALDYPTCIKDDPVWEHAGYRIQNADRRRRLGGTYKEFTVPVKDIQVQSSQLAYLMNLTRAGPNFSPLDDGQYKPCAEQHLFDFLDTPAVREALHVSPKITKPWAKCGGIHYSAHDVNVPANPLYQELIQQGVDGKHNLTMMVYSGDDDAICSTAGTQQWIWEMGVDPLVTWNPWKVAEQTAGFVTHFDLGDKTDASFSFVTVHGAGHEVPAYRPIEALTLFENYLNGQW